MLRLCWRCTTQAWLAAGPPAASLTRLPAHISSSSLLPLGISYHGDGIQQRQCVWHMGFFRLRSTYPSLLCRAPRFELLRHKFSSEFRARKSYQYCIFWHFPFLHYVCTQQPFQLIWCNLSDGLWGDLIKMRWNFNYWHTDCRCRK